MEAQLHSPPSHGDHRHEEDPHTAGVHSVVEGEGEHDHHGKKKSVLKKVKDKAKKIKHTITKHGHEHEHEHRHDQISGEEDDQDEEIENDPEIHGAPMYESTVIRGTNLPKQTDRNTEVPSDTLEKRYNPNVKSPTAGDGVNRPSGLAMAAEFGKSPADVRRFEPEVPFQGGGGETQGGPTMAAEYSMPAAEFRRFEREIPLQGSLDRETQAGPAMAPQYGRPPAEVRQFEREIPLQGGLGKIQAEEATVKIGPLAGLEEDPDSPKSTPLGIPPSNYQAKVVDPIDQGGEEADVAPIVRRFGDMNVRDEAKLKPVAESQVYTGSHDQYAPQGTPTVEGFKQGSNSGGKIPETAWERSAAEQPDTMPADTKAGTISSAAHMIADKAEAAKNLVASKLGYGDQDDQGQDSLNESASNAATEPADSKAGTISSAAYMIAGKAAAAKNLVVSKLGYGDQEQDSLNQAAAESATEHGKTDKGVSVKEYLAEKLRPGYEDKALSNVITEALHKRNEGTQRTTTEEPPIGRVLESEEVVRHLGSKQENKREGEDAMAAGTESSGAGVVDQLKDAVGGWLGRSTGTETAKDSMGQSYVNNAGSSPGSNQGRRLQESEN